MEHQTFYLLNQKIDKVDAKVDELHVDVKSLLKFKWQMVSGALVVSFILTLVFEVGKLLLKP